MDLDLPSYAPNSIGTFAKTATHYALASTESNTAFVICRKGRSSFFNEKSYRTKELPRRASIYLK
ncbi:hypothetical protein PsorP6_005862 [Peronosclerospora sorghi]|uniref:Uncharacterized protein n=1 Tax=Peronosclerospora sorghi TaxID=230839 RepID=A0ACC0W5Y8_9STRA|nr:hypothetical protein PsorP6_005862 [Peronosclerospora sorghi]